MRSPKHIIALFSFLFFSFAAFAQNSASETIPVNGNCGMCKKKIEGAAKDAGATAATWDEKSKVLTVSYDGSKTSNILIQQAVAKSGYDTRDVKATVDAYNALPSCCQYDRKLASATKAACCDGKSCDKDAKGSNGTAMADCCDGKSCDKGAKGDKGSVKADCCDGKSCDKDGKGTKSSAMVGSASCCSKS